MTTFINYLQQAQKTYEFKLKFANIDPTNLRGKLETALDAYCLETLSNVKTLPILENAIDFPALKNCELFIMEATLKYPVNDATLRAIIAERLGLPIGHIAVVPKNNPEEVWRWNDTGESELREFVQGETVIDKPFPDPNKEQKEASKRYAEAGTLLKELSKVKFEIAGNDLTDGAENKPEKVTTGKTTNDTPQNNKDPIGSRQNKIPSPVKGK